MAAWGDSPLFSIAEYKEELGDTTLLTGVNSSDQNEVLENAQSVFTAELKDWLLSDLQDIYARSAPTIPFDEFLRVQGYSYSDLDGMLDKIVNYDALKLTAKAGTTAVLIRRQILQSKLSGMNTEVLILEKASWEKLTKERYESAKRNLRLDLDGDGISSDYERPRTHNTFRRG